MKIKVLAYSVLLLIALSGGACKSPDSGAATNTNNAVNANSENLAAQQQPTIEAAPVQASNDGYKLVTSDTLKLTIHAAGAQETDIFYQPVTADDRALKLKTLPAQADGNFTTDLKIPMDFNSEIWAQAHYLNGETKETEHLLLATQNTAQNTGNNESPNNAANQNQPSDDDDSARSDKKTGGRIEHAALAPNNPDIRITVNVPAFQLTLWQSGKEIAAYPVGVGRKQYPIPIGLRSANKIILNPDWIPPDSEWVRKSSGVEPYERIPASDPDNPLGKIKIPLGDAYLLHEAESPKDLGNLVSHGCVRVLRDDLFALTNDIARARNLDISTQEINAARTDSERRVINLNQPLDVDINYDTMVVEGGVLHLYPDVYERSTNTVENLRTKLASYGVDVSNIDEKILQAMLDKVSRENQFVVSLADLKAGNALAKGKTEPIVPPQAKNAAESKQKKSR
ncbi:MAG: L,D-transpeptidase [Pyrinomonadaceae bacterium]